MKIYTRRGDGGSTGLFGGGRVGKDHPRVEAYGAVDELNAFLGRTLAESDNEGVLRRLGPVQHDLFALGAVLATPGAEDGDAPSSVPPLPHERIGEMEAWMDELSAELPELKAFVLPGGTPDGAALHICRTVCRRAERRVAHLAHTEGVDGTILRYLNRLSDLLFVLARHANAEGRRGDVEWEAPKGEADRP